MRLALGIQEPKLGIGHLENKQALLKEFGIKNGFQALTTGDCDKNFQSWKKTFLLVLKTLFSIMMLLMVLIGGSKVNSWSPTSIGFLRL